MLLPGEKVTTTLTDAGERRIVAFAGVEGSTLTLSAKASRGSRVVPTLSLVAPDGSDVDLGDTNPKGTGRARANQIALSATGTYRIGVESAAQSGGELLLSTKCKVPLKPKWTGVLADAAAVHETFVPAAPGGVIEISVVAKGTPAFDPAVELLAPSGASLRAVVGSKGRAAIPVTRLDELGRYVVRVSGGPGTFTAKAVVKAVTKRTVTYHDVESRPDITAASPDDTQNDTVVTFDLGGFGFSTDQTAAVVSGVATKAAGPVKQIVPGGAKAQVDLAGVPPGSYTLRVVTRDGNTSEAPGTLIVTNRTPGITTMTPVEVSNKYPFQMDLRGAGFDATSTVSIKRVADGLTIPVTVQSRTSHTTILARATPPAYVTGPCDLTIRDPDGAYVTRAGGIDLLGFRSAPASLREYDGPDAWNAFYPRDSVYDATHDRVLLALQEKQTTVEFVLFDPATLTVSDSLVLNAASLGLSGFVVRPRVAWDPVTDTFALGLTAGTAGNAYAVVRVVSATNIHDTRLQTNLVAGSTNVTQTTPAANLRDGGYVVTWEQYSSATGSKLKTQVITPALTVNTSVQPVLMSHSLGYLAEPVIAYQDEGRFVVAWLGAAEGDTNYAVYAAVVDSAGVGVLGSGPYVTASSGTWNDLFQPEIARNPEDGSMLLAFTYLDIDTYRPGVQRLAPVSANPGPYSALDGNSLLPQGYIDSIRWNPARHEFVATMTNAESRVAVRRVNQDGTIRASPVLESYEGIWGVLYSGPEAGELGLVRAFDGTDDDLHFNSTVVMHALAGPLR